MSNECSYCNFVVTIAIIYIVFSAIITYDLGHDAGVAKMQEEATKHNAAEYDSVTGVWRWKQPAVENVK